MATDSKTDIDLEAKLAELMTLSPEQRTWLGQRLFESVPRFESPEAERAFDEMIARRLDDLESGRVQGIPAEQVHAELRRRLEQMAGGEGNP